MGSKCKPRTMRWLSSSEIGWVAGLLEGEGSFFLAASNRQPRVQMQSTDHDVLLRLHGVIGAGCINTVGPRPNRKPCWQYSMGTRNDIDLLLRQIYPMMGRRRRAQIDVVLASFDQRVWDTECA